MQCSGSRMAHGDALVSGGVSFVKTKGRAAPAPPPAAPEAGLGLSGSRTPQSERGPQRVYTGALLVSALIRLVERDDGGGLGEHFSYAYVGVGVGVMGANL